MKKILAMMLGVVLVATASFAQPKKVEKTKAEVKKEVTAAPKTKADGTPDKRFKTPEKPAAVPAAAAAKKVIAAAPKMKADGTPDKRFKDAKATAPVAAGPTKKDGTPDMRYKVNKEAAAKKKG